MFLWDWGELQNIEYFIHGFFHNRAMNRKLKGGSTFPCWFSEAKTNDLNVEVKFSLAASWKIRNGGLFWNPKLFHKSNLR